MKKIIILQFLHELVLLLCHLCFPILDPTTLANVSPIPIESIPEIIGNISKPAVPVQSLGKL